MRFGIDPRRARYQAPELALRFTDTDYSLSGDSIVVCAVADTQSHIPGCCVDSHSVRQRTDAGAALRATFNCEHRMTIAACRAAECRRGSARLHVPQRLFDGCQGFARVHVGRINRPRLPTNMNPFSHQRTKHNTTLVALLVWLFALASGMANACLLEAPGKHPHVAAAHSAEPPHTHVTTGHGAAVDDDVDDQDSSKESCLKACDDGANAQVKFQAGVDLTDPGLAPFVVIAWNAATAVASVSARCEILQVPIVGPPFRTLYSRLTL